MTFWYQQAYRPRLVQDPFISLFSAPCASGKTTAVCDKIASHQFESNYLYVVPSLKLLDEVSHHLSRLGVQTTTINSRTHPQRVKGAIIKYRQLLPLSYAKDKAPRFLRSGEIGG